MNSSTKVGKAFDALNAEIRRLEMDLIAKQCFRFCHAPIPGSDVLLHWRKGPTGEWAFYVGSTGGTSETALTSSSMDRRLQAVPVLRVLAEKAKEEAESFLLEVEEAAAFLKSVKV